MMLNTSSLITFLGTSKPEEAKAFYRHVLGLIFVAEEPFALVFDANGTMLRISILEQHNPPPYTVLGWAVDDIEHTSSELQSRGVEFERYPGFEGDDLGVYTFPNGDKVSWFKDPDGNTLSLTQFNTERNIE